MRLKSVTTVLLVAGLLFLLAWPVVVGHKPQPHTDAYRDWVVRFATYVMLSVLIWVSVALSALFTVRGIRKQLARERAENLRALLEASSSDHAQNDT